MTHLKAIALLLTTAIQTATPSSPTATFHSDILHLDYTYSSSLVADPSLGDQAIQSQKDTTTGLVKAATNCVSLPLTAIDSSNGFRMVVLLRVDGTCIGQPTAPSELAALATNTLTQSLQRFGTPQMAASADYLLATHPAAVLSGSVKSEKYGTTFYGTASCTIQGKDAVCWEFLANDCSKLPELIAYPIKFDGESPQPLIPAKFAQPCKP